MTAAEQILAYIQGHGMATRPELERVFGLYEKTVDSAIRKLERLGCIERAGKTAKQWRKHSAVVFVLSDFSPDLKQVRDCRGRPRKTEVIETISDPKPAHDFEELSRAMNSLFRQEAA